MPYTLPDLPFETGALEPHISTETINYHYGKHHTTYLINLNKLMEGSNLDSLPLTELITTGIEKISPDKRTSVFNNAAQVYNHTFYWNCMKHNGGGKPSGKLAEIINKSFGDFDSFKELFSKTAINTFGSGWAWLVKTGTGSLEIISTSNAGTPLTEKKIPLLTCDVWEHAYYIDYRNARAKYVEAFWNLVNWDFVTRNLG